MHVSCLSLIATCLHPVTTVPLISRLTIIESCGDAWFLRRTLNYLFSSASSVRFTVSVTLLHALVFRPLRFLQ